MLVSRLIAASVLAIAGQPALARSEMRDPVVINEEVGVPVFPHDLADHPYEVVGEIKAGVRKATLFSAEASQKKIYEELWERAEKLGADAVINARYGESRVSGFSWGKTDATGTAIRFTGPATAAPKLTPN